jgi:hypothetical protein
VHTGMTDFFNTKTSQILCLHLAVFDPTSEDYGVELERIWKDAVEAYSRFLGGAKVSPGQGIRCSGRNSN